MKKDNGMIVICTFLALLFLFAGVRSLNFRKDDLVTIGEFVDSELYITNSSKGHSSSYNWKYRYTVDGQVYECYAYGRSQREPSNHTAKIYYDPSNPIKATTNIGDATWFAFVIGGLFLLPLFYRISKSNMPPEYEGNLEESVPQAMYSTDEETGRKAYKRFAWLWVVISISMLVLCFLTDQGAIFIVGLFVAVGVYLLKNAYDPNKVFVSYKVGNATTHYTFTREQFEQSGFSTKKLLDNQFEKEERMSQSNPTNQTKNMKSFLLLFGVILIMIGITWIFVVSAITFLPRILPDPDNTTYTLNGVQVTQEEFYADSNLNNISIVFWIIGLIQFLGGLWMVIKSCRIKKQ